MMRSNALQCSDRLAKRQYACIRIFFKFLLGCLLPVTGIPAYADEASSFCDLTQTQARVRSNLLKYPELFATTGNPYSGNSSTLTAGVRWSLSKYAQSDTVDRLAQSTCDAYRADNKFFEQVQTVEQRANLASLDVMEAPLRQALAAAEAEIKTEEALMRAKVSTLTDVNAAFNARDGIRNQLATLVQTRGRIQEQLPAATQTPLGDLARASLAAKAKMASTNSHLTAQSAWDVSISAGAQTDPRNSNHTSPFIGVSVSYSFGAPAANRAAQSVEELATTYGTEQRDGPIQRLKQAITLAQALTQAEQIILEGLEQRKTFIDSTLVRLNGISTDDGKRAQRQAKVAQLDYQAQLAGSRARLQFLKNWLAKNDVNPNPISN